jgi:hypothetical protein
MIGFLAAVGALTLLISVAFVADAPLASPTALESTTATATGAGTGSRPATAGCSPTATPRFWGSTGNIRLNRPVVTMAGS